MNYGKPALDFPEQADLLIRHGLVADLDELIDTLKRVSYFRLSGYLFPFRQNRTSSQLQAGTTLEEVWDRYVFDRQLRVCAIDALERIEVAIRTQLVTRLTTLHGPFAHVNRAHLPRLTHHRHRKLMAKVERGIDQSREVFVNHYKSKYTSEVHMPLWMVAEVMDYGSILTLFRGAAASVRQGIAADYGVSDRVLESWLIAGNTLRNGCAHHARLWDRVHGTAVMIPHHKNHPDWHLPVPVGQDARRNFAQFTVMQYLLRHIAPQSHWADRLECLWAVKHPAIPIQRMGFPADWKDCPIWATAGSETGGGQKV